jgi:ribonuclease-3
MIYLKRKIMLPPVNLEKLEKRLGLQFKNKNLLINALIHRSFLNENRRLLISSNEKLEFLGDSVLSLASSLYLFRHYPQLSEGDYTEIKSTLVRSETLADLAKKLGLGEFLLLSRGQEKEGGRENTNILADTFEALIAVIFLEFDFETVYQFLLRHLFSVKIDYIVKNKLYLSAKTLLQELTQKRYKNTPIYKTIAEIGPDHKKKFKVEVLINKRPVARGEGYSKKEAEEDAARNALKITHL